MVKPDLGNKRQCQHCATKFFDFNKSPILCPKCGATFVAAPVRASAAARAAVVDDDEVEVETGAELVSLEDADAEDKAVEAVEDVEIEDEGGDEDDTFLAEEEEDDDDVSDLIDGDLKDDEES